MTRWLLGVAVLAGGMLPAAAQDRPEDVVKKAIAAHGGLDALKKFPAATIQGKGKLFVANAELPFAGSIVFQSPGKVRLEIVAEAGGRKVTLLQVVNGEAVKQTENGMPSKLDEATKAELRQSTMMQDMSLLFPLLDSARYTLGAEKDVQAAGTTCAVVLVKAKGLNDTRLYFDRKTGRLVQMERKGRNPEGKEINEVSVFSDFKPAGPILVPMKTVVTHDGRPFMEVTVTEYKPLEKTDDKLFDAR